MPRGKSARTDTQWGLRRAKQSGMRIVEPRPNELQIDIDGSAELAIFRQQWSILENAGITIGWSHHIEPSKRPGKFHATVTLPSSVASVLLHYKEAPNLLRILFQAILGSDIRREAFNLCRVLNGNKYPIVFFEKEP